MDSLGPSQIDLLSAALRHARDARHLLDDPAAASPDQAWHLAGFAPECARRSCLVEEPLRRALGHDLGERADAVLAWGLALDPAAARYDLLGWTARDPALGRWRPADRYARTGTFSPAEVEPLVRAAEVRVARVHADLWLDGRLAAPVPA